LTVGHSGKPREWEDLLAQEDSKDCNTPIKGEGRKRSEEETAFHQGKDYYVLLYSFWVTPFGGGRPTTKNAIRQTTQGLRWKRGVPRGRVVGITGRGNRQFLANSVKRLSSRGGSKTGRSLLVPKSKRTKKK